ncbi:MAG: hypothetical protein RDU20_17765 [Desulfomonilaceae bacterium]|nr:hypothetical protein [Desulfomonilaceae bacterium]
MEKRRITAREILGDVRRGAGDPALMEKYKLSAQGLQSVFQKLLKAGVLTQQELDDRVPVSERTVDLGLNVCRACGHIEAKDFTKCPRCGYVPPDSVKTQVSPEVNKAGRAGKRHAKRSKVPGKTMGPVEKDKEAQDVDTTSEDNVAEAPSVEAIRSYCLTLACVSVVAYVLVVVGLFVVVSAAIRDGFPSATHVLLGGLAAALAGSVMAFLVLLTLRTLKELTKVLARFSHASLDHESSDLDRPIA